MVGAGIRCTQGVYLAELQAIVRALSMLPASAAIRIYSDSRSLIEAINAYEQQLNERKQLRMSACPILQQRDAAGGSVTLSHVKAHTATATITTASLIASPTIMQTSHKADPTRVTR
jgi:ribonuclease HI